MAPRSLIAFPCEGDTLLATLDPAPGTTGLLIVSGGNEVRAGAHRGMALLAHRLAAQGHPVFRYDRRGVGDSGGENGGWESGAPDLAAAVACFRAEQPQVTRVVGHGNCDGAATLALFGAAAGVDALVLANPWLGAEADDLPPAPAIRARYAERLRDPATWARFLTGRVNIRAALRGLAKLTTPPPPDLGQRLAAALDGPFALVLADRDATAQRFRAAWDSPAFAAIRPRATVTTISTASHSFARPGDAEALEAAILAALAPYPVTTTNTGSQ